MWHIYYDPPRHESLRQAIPCHGGRRRREGIILLVASNKDNASLNIREKILTHYPFKEDEERFQGFPVFDAKIGNEDVRLVTLREESVFSQPLQDYFSGYDLVTFISRHSSASGTPTLSVHPPGNTADADLGGIPRTVSIAPANAMRSTLKMMAKLVNEMNLKYKVSYECTHHGPSLDIPTMFAELGSSPSQWGDSEAAEVVALAVMDMVSNFNTSSAQAALGIGGPHYSEKFTKIALTEERAFGHIIPKHAIAHLDAETIKHCAQRTLEKTDLVILDWKGIKGENKPQLTEMLSKIGLECQKR